MHNLNCQQTLLVIATLYKHLFFKLHTVTNLYKLRNNSWKPEFVYSFNIDNIIFVKFLSRAIARDKMQRK